jgi:hypothetical protein
MAGLALLFLPLLILAALGLFILFVIHVFMSIYICIFGPHTFRVVIITLHIVWILLCLRNGKIYGYREILESSEPSMTDLGIVAKSWRNIYHSRDKNRYRPNRDYKDEIDIAQGPFRLHVWGEKYVVEEFPTERWALQRLYQQLGVDTHLTYEEMWLLYKQKWGDRVGFYIEVTEYTYQQEIKLNL